MRFSLEKYVLAIKEENNTFVFGFAFYQESDYTDEEQKKKQNKEKQQRTEIDTDAQRMGKINKAEKQNLGINKEKNIVIEFTVMSCILKLMSIVLHLRSHRQTN